MTIRSINQLLAQAAASFPDNTSELITPALLRNFVTDLLDSISPAYGIISGAPGVLAVTAAPQVIKPFNLQDYVTPGVFTADLPNGTLTRNLLGAPSGTNFIIVRGQITGPANNDIELRVFADGAPTPFATSIATRGAANNCDFTIVALRRATAELTYDVRISGVAANYTISNIRFVIQTQTVRDFV